MNSVTKTSRKYCQQCTLEWHRDKGVADLVYGTRAVLNFKRRTLLIHLIQVVRILSNCLPWYELSVDQYFDNHYRGKDIVVLNESAHLGPVLRMLFFVKAPLRAVRQIQWLERWNRENATD